MRPRELTLTGFRSYRERTTFDFRDRRLVGIVGPIGAGKSSILDGIAFALFGKTPSFGRDTHSLIHQLADVAQVELTFEVDGQVWRVQRALRRKGQGGNKLERLAEDSADAPVLETIEREKPTRERIVQLLGMDFDAFCRSVLLAQNRFQEFLKATPGDRNAVLKGVFGYERFDAAFAASKARVAVDEATIAALQDEGVRLSEARASLEGARAAAVEAKARADAFEHARPSVTALVASAAAAANAAADAEARAGAIARAASALPRDDELTTTLDGTRAAADAEERAAEALAETEATSAAAEAERDALAEATGDLRGFAELVARMDAEAKALADAVGRHERAVEAHRAVAAEALEVERRSVALTDAGIAAQSAQEETAAARAAAEAALHDARHLEMAGELRRGLAVGEPCPVCAQAVATIPPAAKAPATRKAERALTSATASHDRAVAARDAARAALVAAEARQEAVAERVRAAAADVETAGSGVGAAESALAATKSDVVDRLGEGDPKALLDERERALREAEARLKVAAATTSAARTSLDAARRDATVAAAGLAALAATLAGAWGLLGHTKVPATTAEAIRSSFVELGEMLLAQEVEVAAARDAARSAAAEAREGLRAHLEGLGLDPDADFTEALADARAAHAVAEERVRGFEGILASGAGLEQRLDAAAERLALTRRLKDDLQPSQFLAWVLEEEREALAALGSAHLEDLTDGAYRFADDGSFDIADRHAADEVRSSDSLSGGETFLASLALALSLAEMVTRGGGRLDAFFLDEGFGSLDPEHLERAMDGIGRLVAEDPRRLVVLVSHVEEMKQLMEDLIVLDKDDRTGDTRVVSGASAAT